MKSVSRFTLRFLHNTKIREGEFDWHLLNMDHELSDAEEALRNLNGLIESIITGNKTYSFAMFEEDVKQAVREVEGND